MCRQAPFPQITGCMPQLGQATPTPFFHRNLVSLQAGSVGLPVPSSVLGKAPTESRGMDEMTPQPGVMVGQVTLQRWLDLMLSFQQPLSGDPPQWPS